MFETLRFAFRKFLLLDQHLWGMRVKEREMKIGQRKQWLNCDVVVPESSVNLMGRSSAGMALKLSHLKHRGQAFVRPLSYFLDVGYTWGRKITWARQLPLAIPGEGCSCELSRVKTPAAGRISALVLKSESSGIPQYPLQLGNMTA